MWYIACFVRGMTVDEAVKQLSFLNRKGAVIAKEVILEAQRMAVEEHNIEFKSNLWVGEYAYFIDLENFVFRTFIFQPSFNSLSRKFFSQPSPSVQKV